MGHSEPQLNIIIQLRKILAEKRKQYDLELDSQFGYERACILAQEVYRIERLIKSLYEPKLVVNHQP